MLNDKSDQTQSFKTISLKATVSLGTRGEEMNKATRNVQGDKNLKGKGREGQPSKCFDLHGLGSAHISHYSA